MDKENPVRSSRGRPGYVAAAVQRKQQEAAAQAAAGDGNAPLPRVAVLGSQLRSSLVSGGSNRPLSSLRNLGAQPSQSVNHSVRPSSASTQRTGCKPATHSTRSLVPLLDARAAGRAQAQAAASHAPAPSMPSSSAIGDPGLDEEEQQLQAELALYDQKLERIHEQQALRRSVAPDQRAVTPGVSTGPFAAALQPAAAEPQQQQQVQLQAQAEAEQHPEAARPDAELQPEVAGAAAILAAELSIVRAVTTATGTGCKDIIAAHGASALPAGACWTTRGHRVLRLESSAILQLRGRSIADVTLRITFAEASSVPRVVRLEHAPNPTAPFALLGDIRLQPKSLTQLRHLFRLGKRLEVQRCLRITLMGHMAEENSGAHRVSHMLLTSGLGPQRAQPSYSQSAGLGAAAASAAQASVYHSVQSMPGTLATADSADSRDRVCVELTSAAPALSEQQQQQQQASSGSSGPRVPPLALAAMLADCGTTHQPPEAAVAAGSLLAASTEQAPQSEEVTSSQEQPPSEPAEQPPSEPAGQPQAAAEPEDATAGAQQAAASPLPQQSVSVSWHEDPAEAAEGGCAAVGEEAESVAAAPPPAVAAEHSAMEAPPHMAAADSTSAQFVTRIAAVEGAAALLSSACREVQQSELLRTLLRVALLAGNFLNAGNRGSAAAGFQIDALLKLKDVRSTRARSRTLLHFIAREVARQHPTGACLIAALPSAAAAAQLDLLAAKPELQELTTGLRAGPADAAALERLQAAQAQLEQAEEAFKQLGGFINGQRATMDAPPALFGVLHAFAAELDAAHEENSAADAAAADKGGSGRKDGKQRGRSQSGSPASSAGSGEQPRRRRDSAQENSRLAEGAQPEAPLSRLKQQAAERRRSSAAAEEVVGSRPRHHSPQPCLSKAAIAAVGGSRRPAQPSTSAGQAGKSHPGGNQAAAGAVRSSCPPAVQAAALAGAAAPPAAGQAAAGSGDQQADRLSTPIVSLLAESARLIISLDCGDAGFAGFGSALGSAAAASSSAASSGTQGTSASTPDGAVRPADAPVPDADYSTPRGAVSLRWQGQVQGPVRQAAGAGNAAEAQLPAAVLAAGGAGAGERLSMNLLRQRSMHQLSPTSTPLSSLGRQSTRSSGGGGYSSSNGSTPPSSMRVGGKGTMVRRSSSPLGLAAAPGLGAAVVAAEAAAAAARGTLGAEPGPLFSPELTSTPSELPDAERLSTPPDSAPTGASSQPQPAEQPAAPTAQWAAAAAALQQQQEHWESLPSPPVPGKPAPAAPPHEAGSEEAEQEEQAAAAAVPAGFGAMHSAASSFDLTFYAPFSMDRQGQSAFLPAQQARGGLSSSLPCGQDLAGVWGPLAAEQQRQRLRASGGGALGCASVDNLALPRAEAAAGVSKRVSFSLPNSPQHRGGDLSAPGAAASRQPPPLNLAGLAGRLQLLQPPPLGAAEGGTSDSHYHSSASGGVDGTSGAQYMPQLSPVLEALLGSVPTPLPPGARLGQPAGGPDLADDDLVDMAGCSSDQEAEWQQLESIQQQDAEWQRQQAAEQERRTALRLGQSLRQSLSLGQSLGSPHQQAQAGALTEAPAGGQWQVHVGWELPALRQQQQRRADEAAGQGQTQRFQQQQREGVEEEDDEELAALQQLPSPLNSATSDLDAAVARLLASAGNTPTGPLCQGVRQAEVFAAAQQQQREPAALRASAGRLPGGRHMALLEPVMPAPLGEGVRASRGMAQHVPAAALRMSLEGPRPMVLRGAVSAPAAALSQESAAWQADQAAGAAAAGGEGEEGWLATVRPGGALCAA